MTGPIPFIAVGRGEDPPWGDDRTCPACGKRNLPLQAGETISSTDPGAPDIVLHYIAHCGGTWLRGPIGRRP
jgi:hypothetical protein